MLKFYFPSKKKHFYHFYLNIELQSLYKIVRLILIAVTVHFKHEKELMRKHAIIS